MGNQVLNQSTLLSGRAAGCASAAGAEAIALTTSGAGRAGRALRRGTARPLWLTCGTRAPANALLPGGWGPAWSGRQWRRQQRERRRRQRRQRRQWHVQTALQVGRHFHMAPYQYRAGMAHLQGTPAGREQPVCSRMACIYALVGLLIEAMLNDCAWNVVLGAPSPLESGSPMQPSKAAIARPTLPRTPPAQPKASAETESLGCRAQGERRALPLPVRAEGGRFMRGNLRSSGWPSRAPRRRCSRAPAAARRPQPTHHCRLAGRCRQPLVGSRQQQQQ